MIVTRNIGKEHPVRDLENILHAMYDHHGWDGRIFVNANGEMELEVEYQNSTGER